MRYQNPARSKEPTSLGVLMGKARVSFNRQVTELLRARGHLVVRAASAHVFRGIDKSGTTISDLAERASVTKQTMWSLVRELEDCGYTKAVAHPRDRRARLVKLTRKGTRLAADILEASQEVEERVAASMGARRLQAVRRGLKSILEELGEPYRAEGDS